ncbi:MAG: SpoIIIAH-like family protein [Clostridia bacterium]|jgi:stage III sporulation protein AH|nr:SpoIIIAH-like family protein [Clostridia bacterium]
MNIILKRRQLILAVLVVALGAAVFVNWYYTGNSTLSEEGTTNAEYVQNLGEAKYVNATQEAKPTFEEMKFERKKKNDEALDKLNKSLEAAGKGTDEAKSITESINEITRTSKLETDMETLIKAKINNECFVTITKESAQIVVSANVLNEATSLQILEIITTNADIPADKVVMSEQ